MQSVEVKAVGQQRSIGVMTTLIDIEKDVNSRKHWKNPFLQRYCDLTLASLRTTGIDPSVEQSENNINELGLSLHLRNEIISAQIKFLKAEADKVSRSTLYSEHRLEFPER